MLFQNTGSAMTTCFCWQTRTSMSLGLTCGTLKATGSTLNTTTLRLMESETSMPYMSTVTKAVPQTASKSMMGCISVHLITIMMNGRGITALGSGKAAGGTRTAGLPFLMDRTTTNLMCAIAESPGMTGNMSSYEGSKWKYDPHPVKVPPQRQRRLLLVGLQ